MSERVDRLDGEAPPPVALPPGARVLEGEPDARALRIALVVARWNQAITEPLLAGAVAWLTEHGLAGESLLVVRVPGAFELPIAARRVAASGSIDGVAALGCVIRGDTPHFDYVCAEAARGLREAGEDTGIPVAFGVLTVDTADQARARLDKGADAAETAVRMARLLRHVI